MGAVDDVRLASQFSNPKPIPKIGQAAIVLHKLRFSRQQSASFQLFEEELNG
jgi:hypothetical protein